MRFNGNLAAQQVQYSIFLGAAGYLWTLENVFWNMPKSFI